MWVCSVYPKEGKLIFLDESNDLTSSLKFSGLSRSSEHASVEQVPHGISALPRT